MFHFAAHAELIAAFPFPHRVGWEATLEDTTLTIATTIDASGDVAVPVSFGHHPYLRLPGVDRADWEVTIPGARAPATRSAAQHDSDRRARQPG